MSSVTWFVAGVITGFSGSLAALEYTRRRMDKEELWVITHAPSAVGE